MSMPKIYDVATERPPEISVRNLPIGRRMEITGADLLTIAAKIAIIFDISVCTSLLFCENTRKAIRASARWGTKVRALISIDGGRCVFEPIGYDKRAASHENCVVLFG